LDDIFGVGDVAEHSERDAQQVGPVFPPDLVDLGFGWGDGGELVHGAPFLA
jgi:hypothetical protein